MAEIRKLSLTQLQQLINDDDETLANSYISQNLAVARKIQPRIVFSQFKDGPMLMPEMRVLIVKQGWVEPTINLTPHHFETGSLVFVGQNGIAQVKKASPDVHGIGLSMSDELFALAIGNRIPEAFDGHLRDFCLQLTADDMAFLDQVHHLLYLNTRQEKHSAQVTLHLLSTFLWYVNQLWTSQEKTAHHNLSREQRIFADFLQLVNRDVLQQHHVDYYASQLCLSPRYVSTLIRQVSGKPPKAWIEEALINRIKIELRHTDKGITQIADDTNFPNPSFFCKFFKRLTGMTPMEYKLAD